MDVDAVLQSVQERDKWRRRLEVLQTSLGEIRDRRRRVQARLRRIRAELRKLADYSDALLDYSRAYTVQTRGNAPPNSRLPAR